MIKAVLFDLDGTLLPQSDRFLKEYYKGIATTLACFGSDIEAVGRALWAGVDSMVKNNGDVKNEEAFLNVFCKLCPSDKKEVTERALGYYLGAYGELKQYTSENPLARTALEYAARNGRTVVLATNPLLPLVAQRARMSWVGLDESDFALVTSYESDSYSKPNPEYYRSICDRIGVLPEECLMVGNDEYEDMYAAEAAGMQCYLVEGCVIPSAKHPWQGERGSFEDLIQKLENM